MPMELAFITDSDINDVYVPTFQTFVEGSDKIIVSSLK